LDGEGFRVQIETSGTSQLALEAPAFVTVSPKINQAGGLRVLREVIGRADEIKHPCSTERHLAELQELLALGWHRPEVPVWLQPLSMHPKATERCVQWCKRHGYRLSLQTHRLVSIR
jgi:7-carboxy-7-deazaguanine synthase